MKLRAVCFILILSLLSIANAFGLENTPIYALSFGELNPAEMYPVAVAVDSDMNIYVLDELNRRVHVRDPDNNILLIFGSQGTGQGQFAFPRGIALDLDGNIYVTDGLVNRVKKFDSGGTFIRSWACPYPMGIAVSPSGWVYVADTNNSKIQVYDRSGNFLFNWGERGSTGGLLTRPYYIAIDSSGNVWVTDSSAHRVIKYDEDGDYILSFGKRGAAAGQFKAPTGIAIDGSDNVYVYDRWNFRIQKFDQNGNFIRMWGEAGDGDGQFNGLGLATDVNSNVYIADYWNYRCQKFNPAGQFMYKWTGTVTADGEFARVHGISINHFGEIYVTDRINQNIQVFSSEGDFLFKWGTRGEPLPGGPYFNFPRVIDVDSSNNAYITNDSDVRVFDKDGNYLRYWRMPLGSARRSNPLGLAVDGSDNIFISNTNNHQIIKTDTYGNVLQTWGTKGSGAGQFNMPAGIGVDSAGNVYVSDTLNYRIQKFSNNGVFIRLWGSRGDNNGQFRKPIGVAVDPEDNVYVVDEDKAEVQIFDSDGNYLTKFGKPGTGEGEFNHPLYAAIDDFGRDIYVTDSENGRVQKFSLVGNPPPGSDVLPAEFGEVPVNHTWTQVNFDDSFRDPIVIAKPLSRNGQDPAVVRIRNVNPLGFEIRIQEWDYLDGFHLTENVGYIAVERGNYALANGEILMEAGRFATNSTGAMTAVPFRQPFEVVPVVITAVESFNGGQAVTTRLRNVNTQGFEFCMQEQELNAQFHTTESIAYIAWEPSLGTLDDLTFEIGRTQNVVRHNFHPIVFNQTFPNIPVFLADMQTTDGWDTANLRYQNKDLYGVEVQIGEEQSSDAETFHTTEVVGYMLFAPTN